MFKNEIIGKVANLQKARETIKTGVSQSGKEWKMANVTVEHYNPYNAKDKEPKLNKEFFTIWGNIAQNWIGEGRDGRWLRASFDIVNKQDQNGQWKKQFVITSFNWLDPTENVFVGKKSVTPLLNEAVIEPTISVEPIALGSEGWATRNESVSEGLGEDDSILWD